MKTWDKEFDRLVSAIREDGGINYTLSLCGVVLWINREDPESSEDFMSWLMCYSTDEIDAFIYISKIDNAFQMIPESLRRDGAASACAFAVYANRILSVDSNQQKEKPYHGSKEEAIEREIDEAIEKDKSC